MTTAIAAPKTTTSNTKTSIGLPKINSNNYKESSQIEVFTNTSTKTVSNGPTINEEDKSRKDHNIVNTSSAQVASTTIKLSNSPLPVSNSYTLDFLHAVGVQMTGGSNIIAPKTNMRSNEKNSNINPTIANCTNKDVMRDSYNYTHITYSSKQHQMPLPLSLNDAAKLNSDKNRISLYQTQHHYRHHQPQKLTIASFLQKELLEEMSIDINNEHDRNANANNNTTQYNVGRNQQRYSNYYQSHRQHASQQFVTSQLSHRNCDTLLQSDNNNNYSSTAEQQNKNMEKFSLCNMEYSQPYIYPQNYGNGNQRYENAMQHQQHPHCYQHLRYGTNMISTYPNGNSKQLNHISSSSSSCSVSSLGSSCASSVSSASSSTSKTSMSSQRQKLKMSTHSITTKTKDMNASLAQRNIYQRSELNHHYHNYLQGKHNNNNHNRQQRHQKHLMSSTSLKPQHQNLYNLTYVNAYNGKIQRQLTGSNLPEEQLPMFLNKNPCAPTHLNPNGFQALEATIQQSSPIHYTSAPPLLVSTAIGETSIDVPLAPANESDSNTITTEKLCDSEPWSSNLLSLKPSPPSIHPLRIDDNAKTPTLSTYTGPQFELSKNADTPPPHNSIEFVYNILPFSVSTNLHHCETYQPEPVKPMIPQQSHCNKMPSFNCNQNYNDGLVMVQKPSQSQVYLKEVNHINGTGVNNANMEYWDSTQGNDSFYNNVTAAENSKTSFSPRLTEHDSVSQDGQLSTVYHDKQNATQLPVTGYSMLQQQCLGQCTSFSVPHNNSTQCQQKNFQMSIVNKQLPSTLIPGAAADRNYQVAAHNHFNLLCSKSQINSRTNNYCAQSSYDFYVHTPPDRFLARAHLIEVKETPSTLINNSKWDKLSRDIWLKFISSQQTEETFKKKMRLWRYLYIIVKHTYPRYGLYLVGSTISGFGSNSSDVDMCLVSRCASNNDPRMESLFNLTILRDCLNKTGDFENFNLIEAKVPILRFRDRIHQLEVDLNFNNSVGIKNTHLLYCYSQLDWRLRPLVLVTKIWAQYHNINNAKNMTISSYSLALMVIHFLQYAVSPPVLPCLHKLFPDKFSLLRSNDFGYIDMNEIIEPFQSKNTQTIGELFLLFLEYFSFFDYSQNAISVRTGGVLPIIICRQAKSLRNDIHQWKELCIEEPFDLTNTARSVYDYETFEHVKTVFVTSWRILKETLNLNAVLSPIHIPENTLHNDNVTCVTEVQPTIATNNMPENNSYNYLSEVNIRNVNIRKNGIYYINTNSDNTTIHSNNNKISALIS